MLIQQQTCQTAKVIKSLVFEQDRRKAKGIALGEPSDGFLLNIQPPQHYLPIDAISFSGRNKGLGKEGRNRKLPWFRDTYFVSNRSCLRSGMGAHTNRSSRDISVEFHWQQGGNMSEERRKWKVGSFWIVKLIYRDRVLNLGRTQDNSNHVYFSFCFIWAFVLDLVFEWIKWPIQTNKIWLSKKKSLTKHAISLRREFLMEFQIWHFTSVPN